MKAQSAMEYLMTYGWAILIVIIVAAALYALGVFNPSTLTGQRSTGFPNLGAPSEWQYSATTFNIIMRNNLGQSVSLSGGNHTVTCGTAGAAVNLTDTGSGDWAAGAARTFQATGCTSLGTGSSYSLTVNVQYQKSGGTYWNTEVGTVTGTAA